MWIRPIAQMNGLWQLIFLLSIPWFKPRVLESHGSVEGNLCYLSNSTISVSKPELCMPDM